jgi:hypothetical protein
MKRYSEVAAAKQFSTLLDAAERGERVVIERRGAQFELHRLQAKRVSARRVPLVAFTDAAVESGQWAWRLKGAELQFIGRVTRS